MKQLVRFSLDHPNDFLYGCSSNVEDTIYLIKNWQEDNTFELEDDEYVFYAKSKIDLTYYKKVLNVSKDVVGINLITVEKFNYEKCTIESVAPYILKNKTCKIESIPPYILKQEDGDKNLFIKSLFPTGLKSDKSYQFDFPTQVDENGNMWNNLEIEVGENNKLKIKENLNGWYGSGNMLYLVESSNNFLTKSQLENIDFSNQKGEDVLIYAVDAATINREHIQIGWTFVHIKGDVETDVPNFIARNPSKRMPQAPYTFPNVELPTNKKNILHFRQTDENGVEVSHNFLEKGWSIGISDKPSEQRVAIYDEWIRQQIGNPDTNLVSIPEIQKMSEEWLRQNSIQTIYNAFKQVIDAGSGKGFLFMDWEYIGFDIFSQDVVNKLGTCFNEFHKANPNCMLSSYIHGNPFYDISIDSTTDAGRRQINEKFNKTQTELAKGFFGKISYLMDVNTGQFTGESQIMGKYLTPFVGIYNYTVKKHVLYDTIMEYELCNKFGMKALSMNWGLTEGLGGSDFDTYPRRFKKSNGQSYYRQTKPPCPPSHMRNTAIISNFFGMGLWFWDEPLPFMEGYEYWGGNARTVDDRNYLPNDFLPPHFSSMHFTTQIGYDYATRGLYEMSFNSDIIGDDANKIYRPEFSLDGGKTYFKDDDLLPASANYLKIPLVRLRKHPTKDEWLLFAMTRFQDHWKNQTVKVKIGDNTIDVTLKGLHANLSRIVNK